MRSEKIKLIDRNRQETADNAINAIGTCNKRWCYINKKLLKKSNLDWKWKRKWGSTHRSRLNAGWLVCQYLFCLFVFCLLLHWCVCAQMCTVIFVWLKSWPVIYWDRRQLLQYASFSRADFFDSLALSIFQSVSQSVGACLQNVRSYKDWQLSHRKAKEANKDTPTKWGQTEKTATNDTPKTVYLFIQSIPISMLLNFD